MYFILGFYCLETPQCMDLCDIPTTYNNILLTIGSTSGSVSVYDITKSNELRGKSQLHESGAGIRRLKFIPTIGLVSAGMDSKICISDVEKWKVGEAYKYLFKYIIIKKPGAFGTDFSSFFSLIY